MYYSGKIDILKDIFSKKDIKLEETHLMVDDCTYPIIDDVIILLDQNQYPTAIRNKLDTANIDLETGPSDFNRDIQYSFGKEWQEFPKILPEHDREFQQYFDMVDLSDLKDQRVCDLGCGIGRWSYFLSGKCRELILIDFSEAIFVARRNMANAENALFFMADLKKLPFSDNFADFLFCLGVLHHLPTPALDEVKSLKNYAPRLLIYLYYLLDNRPLYFRKLFSLVDLLRRSVSKYRSPLFRSIFTWYIALVLYKPLVILGTLLQPIGLSRRVPLYETYKGKSLERIRQDVYDRFFTMIEQRFSRNQIIELKDTFSQIIISDQLPYWHFICRR